MNYALFVAVVISAMMLIYAQSQYELKRTASVCDFDAAYFLPRVDYTCRGILKIKTKTGEIKRMKTTAHKCIKQGNKVDVC